jgi:hypothetical protein
MRVVTYLCWIATPLITTSVITSTQQSGAIRHVAIESEVKRAINRWLLVVRMYVTETTQAVYLDVAQFAGRFRRIPQKWVITTLLVPGWLRTLIHHVCFSLGERLVTGEEENLVYGISV